MFSKFFLFHIVDLHEIANSWDILNNAYRLAALYSQNNCFVILNTNLCQLPSLPFPERNTSEVAHKQAQELP